MKTSEFNYYLPEELIAQTPLENRAQSKMMCLNKKTGNIEEDIFENIDKYLKKGDCLVLNDTKVMPARLLGNREGKEEVIEVLLLKQLSGDDWECIVRPGKKMKIGSNLIFGQGLLKLEVIDITEDGNRIVRFYYNGIFNEILDKIGLMPLPPYIKEKLEDKEMYQTVYSKYLGSAAAPTAGLHFTKKLLEKLENEGINIAYVTLHVGLGTFRPVKVDDVTKHKMHSEEYFVTQEACDKINKTKKNGGKIIAVGTTSCRVLESVADENGIVKPIHENTEIFIYPRI